MWFGTGKNQRYIPLHLVAQNIGIEKCLALPLFHALTGCDQVSFFAGRGKKVAWKTWKQYDELTDALQSIAFCPPKETMETVLHVIERFVVLLYDRTSICTRVNDCRMELFAKKGRLPEGIPPTLDALKLHIQRAVYQASYCWAQSLSKDAMLPDPNEWWGWKSQDSLYEVVWTTLPEASKKCQELIRCGCNPEKGCKGRCKCANASLRCTALCKCGGDCER